MENGTTSLPGELQLCLDRVHGRATIVRKVDDYASQQIIKKLSKNALKIGADGLEATPIAFGVEMMIYSPVWEAATVVEFAQTKRQSHRLPHLLESLEVKRVHRATTKFLFLILWIPMIVLGLVLNSKLFTQGTPASYAFLAGWPLLNFYIVKKLRGGYEKILLIRLVSYFLVECAALAIVLLLT